MPMFYSTHSPRPRLTPGAQVGFVMEHRTGSDRGFSWDAQNPNFSDEWTRIPVGVIAPAPQRMTPEAIAQFIADTAESQGIEPEAVEAFSALLTAVARGAEDRLLTQLPAADTDSGAAAGNPVPTVNTIDGHVFGSLLAELLDAAEASITKNNRFIYRAARDRLVQHLNCWGQLREQHPGAPITPGLDPVAAALVFAGLSCDEAVALATAARSRALHGTNAASAESALDSLEARLEQVYGACCGTSPKQELGELIDALMHLPEWATVRAAITTGGA